MGVSTTPPPPLGVDFKVRSNYGFFKNIAFYNQNDFSKVAALFSRILAGTLSRDQLPIVYQRLWMYWLQAGSYVLRVRGWAGVGACWRVGYRKPSRIRRRPAISKIFGVSESQLDNYVSTCNFDHLSILEIRVSIISHMTNARVCWAWTWMSIKSHKTNVPVSWETLAFYDI